MRVGRKKQDRSNARGTGMTTVRTVRQAVLLVGLTQLATAAGCVDRRFVVETNVPNAQVYIDNKSVGAAPAYHPFEYYGYYTIKVVHPGYETLVRREHVVAPWYAYPPFDFIAEVLWPFHIRDTRKFVYELHESVPSRTDDILNRAEALQQRGWMLPPAERPAEPRPPAGQPLPPPQPLPGIGPPVGPAPAPGLVPSVQPGYSPVGSYVK
jgi:hypothetical protein